MPHLIDGEETLDLLYSFWFELEKFKKTKTSTKNIDDIRSMKPKNSKFYLDSGVFSARAKGIILPVDILIDFVLRQEGLIDFVFNMDNGSKEEQLENCRKMKQAGLPVIGIFHGDRIGSNMPLDYIDRFLEYTDYIGVGVKNTDINVNMKYLDMIFDYVYKKNLWPVRFHLLGSETVKLLSKYPFYSSDASTIVQTYIMGKVSKWNKKNLKIEMLHPRNEPMTSAKHIIPLENYIEKHYTKLGQRQDLARYERVKISIPERFHLQRMITKLWEDRGIAWK